MSVTVDVIFLLLSRLTIRSGVLAAIVFITFDRGHTPGLSWCTYALPAAALSAFSGNRLFGAVLRDPALYQLSHRGRR